MNAKQEFFPITVSAAHTVKEERMSEMKRTNIFKKALALTSCADIGGCDAGDSFFMPTQKRRFGCK